MKQIDFNLLFKEFFHKKELRNFNIRDDSNMTHDVFFLNSLIHDAKINIFNIEQNILEKKIIIPITRYCNEHSYNQDEIYCKSIIMFKDVKSILLNSGNILSKLDDTEDNIIFNDFKFDKECTFYIDKIFISDTSYKRFSDFKCKIMGRPYNWEIDIVFNEDVNIQLIDVEYLD